MKRALTVWIGVLTLAVVLGCGLALAQDQEYALKDYMPETVGSKWTMKMTRDQGEVTIIYEVDKARDIGGQQAMPILMKSQDGTLMRGSLESVSDTSLTLYGTIMVPRGDQAGGEPVTMLYTPPAVFPGKMKVGETKEAAVQSSRGDRQMDLTMKLALAAVEPVTVPKGTFEGCLKLVYTTSFGRGEMTRTIWYAKGVGIVKTETSGYGNRPAQVAELTDYELGK
jgi:hypothetical protein